MPVDEVVTLTLFYREDEHLRRLMLDDAQTAALDRLWDELHFVSEAPLKLVDVFEQLWQFATQDADPSAFEPMREPIKQRAAAFKKLLVDVEPRHVQAVLDFADTRLAASAHGCRAGRTARALSEAARAGTAARRRGPPDARARAGGAGVSLSR